MMRPIIYTGSGSSGAVGVDTVARAAIAALDARVNAFHGVVAPTFNTAAAVTQSNRIATIVLGTASGENALDNLAITRFEYGGIDKSSEITGTYPNFVWDASGETTDLVLSFDVTATDSVTAATAISTAAITIDTLAATITTAFADSVVNVTADEALAQFWLSISTASITTPADIQAGTGAIVSAGPSVYDGTNAVDVPMDLGATTSQDLYLNMYALDANGIPTVTSTLFAYTETAAPSAYAMNRVLYQGSDATLRGTQSIKHTPLSAVIPSLEKFTFFAHINMVALMTGNDGIFTLEGFGGPSLAVTSDSALGASNIGIELRQPSTQTSRARIVTAVGEADTHRIFAGEFVLVLFSVDFANGLMTLAVNDTPVTGPRQLVYNAPNTSVAGEDTTGYAICSQSASGNTNNPDVDLHLGDMGIVNGVYVDCHDAAVRAKFAETFDKKTDALFGTNGDLMPIHHYGDAATWDTNQGTLGGGGNVTDMTVLAGYS